MKKITNPIYSIYPTIFCSGSILVNDVPVRDWYGERTKKGGFTGDIPLNNVLLKSGTYKVEGRMLPRYGQEFITEEEWMRIKFFHYENGEFKTKQPYPPIESPWGGLSEGIKHTNFEISTEIEVDLPFEVAGWEGSLDLRKENEEQLFNEVLAYYEQIRMVLQEHHASNFLEMAQAKMKIQETTLYFDKARKKKLFNGNF